ncbi:MAG TPA: RcnB family protein [Sphingomonas sp.]|jgi:Ni/Co efflux regulator RcnB|nr:RcnB family protein [Sphingomonas sp.]
MRKFILLALMAATALPGAAMAQSRGELRRDRQDIRQEQRQLDNARARGDRRAIRDNREDLREARQEYREDRADRNRNWGRNDWRGYRTSNRTVYSRGNWRAPFGYNNFRSGGRIQPNFYGSRYWITDPYRYRLPGVRGGQRWVRHYDDVLLVDTRRGVVLDVMRGFFW